MDGVANYVSGIVGCPRGLYSRHSFRDPGVRGAILRHITDEEVDACAEEAERRAAAIRRKLRLMLNGLCPRRYSHSAATARAGKAMTLAPLPSSQSA